MAEKRHGPHCGRLGCNCDEGKAAHAKRMREWRANKRAEKEKDSGAVRVPVLRVVPSPEVERLVDDAPSAPTRPVSVESDRPLGRVGRAVLLQISRIPDAEVEHAALVALAVALAETVDDPRTEVKDRTAAAREIKSLLGQMKPAAAAPQKSAQTLFLERLAAPL